MSPERKAKRFNTLCGLSKKACEDGNLTGDGAALEACHRKALGFQQRCRELLPDGAEARWHGEWPTVTHKGTQYRYSFSPDLWASQ